jgi:REP element-mobilizing transposase RayT
MRRGLEGTKSCHLVWVTRNGRSCFKIAEAARFCERAVHHACTALGWTPELVAVLPDRVHSLVTIPATEDRRTVSVRLQKATTQLLRDGNFLPDGEDRVWAGEGWCAVLPNAVAAAAVRRVLARRLTETSTPAATSPP